MDNSKNPNLQKIYTDQSGNDWFEFVNPLEISAIRGIAAQKAQRFASMMITESQLKTLLEEQSEAAKSMDIMRVLAISQEIKIRLNLVCEETSVLDLSNIYFFLKDEDPNIVTDSFFQKKKEIWAKDMACRSFFLHMGLRLTNKLQSSQEEDLIQYLEKTKHLAERINLMYSNP